MPSRNRTALAAALTAASVALVPTAAHAQSAPAKQTQKKSMWGPVTLDGVSQFPAYRDLGVKIYQYPVFWRSVAATRPANAADPSDPAYQWPAELDTAVTEAAKYGMRVAVRISQTPAWANGGKAGSVLPTNRADFTTFLRAFAKRYPTVRIWEIWEEPNLSRNLQLDSSSTFVRGQDIPNTKPLTSRQRSQIGNYARLVDASYGTLKAVSKSNLVVGGNVTSCGSVGPERFMQGMRLANGKPPRMDLFGVNPYGPREPTSPTNSISPGCADFPKLRDVYGWTKALDRNKKGKRLFISEYSDATGPQAFFNWYVTPAAQARRITKALRVVRRSPWIYTFGWYSFADVTDPSGDLAPLGLIDAQGNPKPGYAAFKAG